MHGESFCKHVMNVSSVGIIERWYRITLTLFLIDQDSVMVLHHVMRHCFNDELGSDPSVLFADDMGASYTVETMFCNWS